MVKLFVCLCLFGGFPRKLCVILSEKKELKYLIIIIIDAALCVLISLLICFIRFVLAECVRVGDLVVRFKSAMSARCPRCVFCGKRDAAASTIGATASPELPRMQRVTLPVQALHSLAEIRILTGGLQAHSGFFRFCLFLRLSVVYVPLCAAQCNAFAGNTLHTNSVVVMTSWGRVATTSHQRQKTNADTPHPRDVRRGSDGDCQRSAKSGRRTQTL